VLVKLGNKERAREKVAVFACQTIEMELLRALDMLPETRRHKFEVEFLPYALHRTPNTLNSEIQKRLSASRDAGAVVLGYGLCSNGVLGLSPAPGQRLIIPRVHDCISMLLGSRDIYAREFEAEPGTIYLSRGWIEAKGDPFSQYLDYVSRYGEETARWAMSEEYKNYKRVCFIDTGVPDAEKFRLYSRRVAEFLGLDYSEKLGSLDLLNKLVVCEEGHDDEVLVIDHPHKVEQDVFLADSRAIKP
jgi:hypothetical protein